MKKLGKIIYLVINTSVLISLDVILWILCARVWNKGKVPIGFIPASIFVALIITGVLAITWFGLNYWLFENEKRNSS